MIPTQGRMVTVKNFESNGTGEQAAVVTRAWADKDTRDAPVTVNVMVLPDVGVPTSLTSIQLFDTREAAEEFLAKQGANKLHVAFWPERVRQ